MPTRFMFGCLVLAALAGKVRADGCRLFLLGDSIMVQYQPVLRSYLPADWVVDSKQDRAGAPPAANNLDVPTGANGGDSGMVLSYLLTRAAHDPIRADLLVLNCGLHDLRCDLKTGAKQVTLADYKKNLRAIVDLAVRMRTSLVWVRITPVVDAVHNQPTMAFFRHATDVADYNAAADEIMQESGVPEIDLYRFTGHFIPGAYVDHVHYDAATQQRQAAFIAGALEAIWTRSGAAVAAPAGAARARPGPRPELPAQPTK
jgi:lysophospholipase L1-like esterase